MTPAIRAQRRRSASNIWLLACVVAAVCLAFPIQAQAHRAFTQNFTIRNSDGDTVGNHSEVLELAGDLQIRTVERELAFSVDGHSPLKSSYRATQTFQDGVLRSIIIAAETNGARHSFVIGITGNEARITDFRNPQNGEKTQIIDNSLPLLDPASVTIYQAGHYNTFDVGSGRFVEVEIKLIDYADSRHLRVTYQGDSPTDALIVEIDENDLVTGAIRPQFGAPFRFVARADEEKAPGLSGGTRMAHPFLPSPYDINSAARKRHIRYRFALPDAISADLPQTAEQAVSFANGKLRIDVCPECGPGIPTDEASLARWRRPTAWMQSDDPAIALWAKSARSRISDAKTMERLSQRTRSRLKDVDFTGHYSARAAWQRRAGDCTEDAVLLATMARAAGIPALVASGMVYSRDRYHGERDGFMPHSWVIAYTDGAWRSYDMTIGEFDSAHVAFTVGEGEANTIAAAYLIAGLLEWEALSEVRPRPEN